MQKAIKTELILMTPEEFKGKVHPLVIEYSVFKTKFGTCLVASTDKGICNILFGDSKKETVDDLKLRWPHARLASKANVLHEQVQEFFDTGISKTKIKLHVYGTPFQLHVWNELTMIPAGSTSTYAKIASVMGDSKKSRAVGTAIGKNPVGYIIPCHRVIASSGKLSGFRWGTACKQKMLDLESL